jgi:hypothetical protein
MTLSGSGLAFRTGAVCPCRMCMTHDTHDSGAPVQYHPVAIRLSEPHGPWAGTSARVRVRQIVLRINNVVTTIAPSRVMHVMRHAQLYDLDGHGPPFRDWFDPTGPT